MVTRRQTFRLYPNKPQEKALFGARRLHCYLYNACISHRQTEYKHNHKSITYFDQQNLLPAFKAEWVEFAALHSQTLQTTVKRVDLAYNAFFTGQRGKPKFKSIRNYSGWGYPAKSGWKVDSTGKHGTVKLNDLGITLKMRGQAKDWGIPTTLMIVYKPSKRQWFASFTVEVATPDSRFGSESDLAYESIAAYDLGTETALTLFDGAEFEEIENPRFSHKNDEKVRKAAKQKRRKRAPKKGVKASRRWKKINKRESNLKAKVARQRKDWQHKVTSDIASRYDIGVTEKLNTKGMTHTAKKGSKRKAQKAGLNKSILSVGFGTLNKMISYKIEQKGGLVLQLPTRIIKPSQRCPKCGTVHKEWAELKNRYHICSDCGFEVPRDQGSAMVMYNVATNQQPGLGTSLDSLGCFSATSETRKTVSMKQLGQKKRQKSSAMADGVSKTPSAIAVR
ncbi:transposase [Leptolyngbya boryana CZ1]|uniref:Transposase n=1 Tax=Leptolyngbya boryana CZ1 TaxID=3060204 RepID=A0AA96WZI9_LEPBY|nr:transposase [Leptolyngbya boryana]WNZ48327.1 transposase [Leptolyngbya boryana CZ1]